MVAQMTLGSSKSIQRERERKKNANQRKILKRSHTGMAPLPVSPTG